MEQDEDDAGMSVTAQGGKLIVQKRQVQEMIEEEEDKVTVPKLMQKTGLSRGFFYKNPEVRKAVDRALQLQAGMVDKRRKILDIGSCTTKSRIKEQQVAKLKRENETLRK